MEKEYHGYEGLYSVTTDGNVISLNYRKSNKTHVMRPVPTKNGYLTVRLSKDGVAKRFYIHRMVAEAFIPNPKNLPEVNHKDENKSNNSVENLEWCDREYNCNYGKSRKNDPVKSKPVLQYTKDGCYIKEWPSLNEIGRSLGCCSQNIARCCKGETTHAYGYIWRYA